MKGTVMLKTDTPDDLDRLKAIAEAAVAYVELRNGPSDGPGHQGQRDQQAAFRRLADLVEQGRADG
jgi:hypothetical protein